MFSTAGDGRLARQEEEETGASLYRQAKQAFLTSAQSVCLSSIVQPKEVSRLLTSLNRCCHLLPNSSVNDEDRCLQTDQNPYFSCCC